MPAPKGDLPVNVTFDLATVLVAGTALVAGCYVYRWMAPTAQAVTTTTKGERLLAAITAAAAVVAIGAFLAGGIKAAEPSSGSPALGPKITSTGSTP
ncbi:hypothetical protein PV726_43080 [Streptomyces europaeiscabiei]|uniref:hypothetical protein n=1 Tax=Streptomyces europaeiscabiei TaxID=146819 RepID=UPI0029A0706D|nr:hypothetical protein [Streptomyces europaeiscabiei]MDX3696915.1 hypothetical protein [Streptomyces europaeiscabiei]